MQYNTFGHALLTRIYSKSTNSYLRERPFDFIGGGAMGSAGGWKIDFSKENIGPKFPEEKQDWVNSTVRLCNVQLKGPKTSSSRI